MKLLIAIATVGLACALSACATPPQPIPAAQANQAKSRIVTRDLSKGGVIIPNPERL